MEQKKGILEQIEDIQKLAEQLEKDSRELTQDIFSFENISKMCKPYWLEDKESPSKTLSTGL